MPSGIIKDEFIRIIFKDYQDRVLDPDYYPSTPEETLKARLTAVYLLQDSNAVIIHQAEDFIHKTSTTKKEDLERLKLFAHRVVSWDQFKILSSYENSTGPFLEYKLSITNKDGASETIHLHALYKILGNQCCYVSQTPPLVRVLGDSVLHQSGTNFPEKYTAKELVELQRQINIAKDILVETFGAGIAANQCATIQNPYRFAIVGVFYEIPKHIEGVNRRYPNVIFPEARIMVNPVILSSSKKMQNFKHACLSVPSPNRCTISSPEEIEVAYRDPLKAMHSVSITMKGMDAVVLWHELNHILDGKTYLDTAIASLTSKDLSLLETMISAEYSARQLKATIPILTVPPFYHTILIHEDGQIRLDTKVLEEALAKMTEETLLGLQLRCKAFILSKTKHPEEFSTDLLLPRPSDVVSRRSSTAFMAREMNCTPTPMHTAPKPTQLEKTKPIDPVIAPSAIESTDDVPTDPALDKPPTCNL